MASLRALVRAHILLYSLVVFSLLATISIAQQDSYTHQDHNHHRLHHDVINDLDWGDGQSTPEIYEPEFNVGGYGRELVGRAIQDVNPLQNNVPLQYQIGPGQTVYYVVDGTKVTSANSTNALPKELPKHFGVFGKRDEEQHGGNLELRRRQDEKRIYISVNTCSQPSTNSSTEAKSLQLTLYWSTTNQNPGPGQSDLEHQVPFLEGYANFSMEAGANLYLGVGAPNMTTTSSALWNFAIATSFDDYYFHSTPASLALPAAYLLDTDSTTALMVTNNLTDSNRTAENTSEAEYWMKNPLPFNMMVIPASSNINGMRDSFCGLARLASTSLQINSTVTTRNRGHNPKQQFAVGGLTPGTKYWAVLSYNGVNVGNTTTTQASGVARGGGQVWQAFEFTTKSDANCKLIYDLPFCSNVAYAVPSNSTATKEELISFYDNNARNIYQNFSYSLQQIACKTTSSAQYSLSRNCDDCDADYKNWLCAVTIPRCMDFTSIPIPAISSTRKNQFVQPRNLGASTYINDTAVDLSSVGLSTLNQSNPFQNYSRNPLIDTVIKPGPYNELLPCIELCYELVKSCPAKLNFACPRQASLMLTSYGDLGEDHYAARTGMLACNWVGVDQPTAKAFGIRLSTNRSLIVIVSIILATVLV